MALESLASQGLRMEVLKYRIFASDKLKMHSECKSLIEFYLTYNPIDIDVIKIKIQVLKSNREFAELSEYLDYLTANIPINLDQINLTTVP